MCGGEVIAREGLRECTGRAGSASAGHAPVGDKASGAQGYGLRV